MKIRDCPAAVWRNDRRHQHWPLAGKRRPLGTHPTGCPPPSPNTCQHSGRHARSNRPSVSWEDRVRLEAPCLRGPVCFEERACRSSSTSSLPACSALPPTRPDQARTGLRGRGSQPGRTGPAHRDRDGSPAGPRRRRRRRELVGFPSGPDQAGGRAECRRARIPVRLVYFSSASPNTHRFVRKLGLEAQRIPLHSHEPALQVTHSPSCSWCPPMAVARRAVPFPMSR